MIHYFLKQRIYYFNIIHINFMFTQFTLNHLLIILMFNNLYLNILQNNFSFIYLYINTYIYYNFDIFFSINFQQNNIHYFLMLKMHKMDTFTQTHHNHVLFLHTLLIFHHCFPFNFLIYLNHLILAIS